MVISQRGRICIIHKDSQAFFNLLPWPRFVVNYKAYELEIQSLRAIEDFPWNRF